MHPRRRMVLLTTLALALAVSVGATTGLLLYRTGLAREGEALRAVVRSQVALAEATFRHELTHPVPDTATAVAGTLEVLREANRTFVGFGETGEFTVARRRGDTLVFEIGLRAAADQVPAPILLPSDLGVPAQRAVAGESGVTRGLDYRGEWVVAAHAPIGGTGLGMVAKRDLAEVRAPYVRSALTAAALGLLLVVLGLTVGEPVVVRLLASVEERERAYRMLVENFPGVVFQSRVDASGTWRFEVLEGAVEEITGYPAKRFLESAAAWGELIHEEDRAAAAARAEAYAAGTVAWPEVEYRIRRRDGSVAWVRGMARAAPGAAGSTTVMGSFYDVTEARRGEEEMGASRERLRLAVLAGGHGLYDLDLRTGRAVVNDEYARMLGYDPATFVETNAAWRDRIHPDDRDEVYAEFEAYVAGRRDAYRVEFRQRTAAGGWRWILSLGAVVERDADGRPLRMVGTHTDIQTRKDAEAALLESEDRFRRAVEASPDAILIQTGGRFAYANPAALALFGARAPDELIGSEVLDRFPASHRDVLRRRMHTVNVERTPVPPLLEEIVRIDGTMVRAEVSAVPFRYQGEHAALAFARDVTERVESEGRLRAHLDELSRWQAVMLDREDRVQELKREVNDLCRRVGDAPRYSGQAPEAGT